MLDGFNIANSDAILLFTQAIRTSPRYPLSLTFDLADLGRHNILEHDSKFFLGNMSHFAILVDRTSDIC